MAKMNKRTQAATANLDRNINYSVADAAKLVKDGATSKFDETIELAINLGLTHVTLTRWCGALFPCQMALVKMFA